MDLMQSTSSAHVNIYSLAMKNSTRYQGEMFRLVPEIRKDISLDEDEIHMNTSFERKKERWRFEHELTIQETHVVWLGKDLHGDGLSTPQHS